MDGGVLHRAQSPTDVEAERDRRNVSRRTTTRAWPSADEHDRRARHLVVVGGHRVPVGAGGRRREQVAGLHPGWEVRVGDEDVALLAVLADDAAAQRPGLVDPGREVRLVAGAVQDGPRVVAHPPVDGDVGADAGDLLDRPDPVERDGARRGDRPARLDPELRGPPAGAGPATARRRRAAPPT